MAEADDDDPWGFIAPRKREASAADDAPTEAPPPSPAEQLPAAPAAAEAEAGVDALAALAGQSVRSQRQRGELRAEMGGESLKKRAWPMALALGLLMLAGYLTEIVASSQMLARVGSSALLVIFPLGGISLIVVALVQFRYIDHRARLPMIRTVALAYAVAFAIAVGLLSQSVWPVVAIGLVWLLADQLNFLMPLLIWSLASDEFNVAESRKVYPWIVTWTYAGQTVGLGLSAVSPWLLTSLDIPLTALLVIPPIVCAFIAFWLPHVLRGTQAARGSSKPEDLGEAISSARDFIEGVPVWRHFFAASVLTFIAGGTLYLLFLADAERIIGSDAAALQTLLGFAALAWFAVCWAIQSWGAERLQNRIGIPGVLLVLPVALVVGGVLLAIGSFAGSLAVLIVGISFWIVPRWSIDENARRSALALVPDERRARVSFVVDLAPIALGLIVSGPLALFGIVTGHYWVVAVAAVVIAAIAIRPSLQVRRDWEDSLLNWRLRRRKQNRAIDL